MGSTNKTAIIELPLFTDDDRPSWRGDVNGAMNTIDAAFGTDRGNIGDINVNLATKVAKDSQLINLLDHVALSATDSTAALQTFFDSDTVSNGSHVLIPNGTWRVDGTVTINNSNVVVSMGSSVVWDRSYAASGTETLSAIVVNGNNVIINGNGATIKSPSFWDGHNAAWTDAVIKFVGDSPTINQINLLNVPRIGLGFTCNGLARVTDVGIIGNYPQAQWTEVETVNQGIAYDPSVTDARILVRGLRVDSCVQGICLANHGAGASSGSKIVESTFTNCWNHGIYNAGGCYQVITNGNDFYNCSRPIIMWGDGNIVTNNSIYTTGTGTDLNESAGVSMRNATNCVVSNNRIMGDSSAPTAGAIALFPISGGTEISGNVVTNNRISVTTAVDGYGIQMGDTTVTNWRNNIIANNVIEANGVVQNGVISALAAPSNPGIGCQIKNNTVIMTGTSSGIYVSSMSAAQIHSNIYINQSNPATAQTLGGVRISGTCDSCEVKNNQFTTQVGYGANTTLRCVWEESGQSITKSRITDNTFVLNSTTMTSVVTHSLINGNSVINECLNSIPTFLAGAGSMVRCTLGGASTTLYIKETGSSSNVWRAI